MSRYQYKTSYHHKRVQARRTHVLALMAVFAVIIFVVIVAVDQLRSVLTERQPESSVSTAVVEGATANFFSTRYFQFQTDRTWAEVPEESTESTFVYKSLDGQFVRHMLRVHVNEVPRKLFGTRILPVEIVENGQFRRVAGVSDHCNNAVDESARLAPTIVEYQQVTFNCNVDGVNYKVLVGVVGGTNTITAPRPSGGSADYTIEYEDLTVNPNSNQIHSIMNTFQTR